MNERDYIIVGSGIGGLFLGALLASEGKRVLIFEKHYVVGGYGHSFEKQGYTFCAQLHYLWNCAESEAGGRFFKKIGLDQEVTFTRLNLNGFDHVRFPDFDYVIQAGFDRNIEELSRRFPESKEMLKRYFSLLAELNEEIQALPIDFTYFSVLRSPLKFRKLIKYSTWTLEKLFEKFEFSVELRSILAGQSGNLLLPPEKVSLPIHAAMVVGYDQGACVPTKGYKHMFESIESYINSQPGCEVRRKAEIKKIETDQGKVSAVIDKKDLSYEAKNYVFNTDPKLFASLLDDEIKDNSFKKKLSYDYSASCVTIYLGLKGIDLSKHGFGNWNLWHYTKNNINQVYEDHYGLNDFSRPSLFISTPSLHKTGHSIAPPGCEQMILCSHCPYDYFAEIRRNLGRKEYLEAKKAFADRMIDEVERNYIPHIRDHIDFISVGSPLTNEFWVNAPQGNAYGANLTPGNFRLGKLSYKTPYKNAYLVGASAGAPSFAAGVHFASKLFNKLIKKPV